MSTKNKSISQFFNPRKKAQVDAKHPVAPKLKDDVKLETTREKVCHGTLVEMLPFYLAISTHPRHVPPPHHLVDRCLRYEITACS